MLVRGLTNLVCTVQLKAFELVGGDWVVHDPFFAFIPIHHAYTIALQAGIGFGFYGRKSVARRGMWESPTVTSFGRSPETNVEDLAKKRPAERYVCNADGCCRLSNIPTKKNRTVFHREIEIPVENSGQNLEDDQSSLIAISPGYTLTTKIPRLNIAHKTSFLFNGS
jgi:hypothetical protein